MRSLDARDQDGPRWMLSAPLPLSTTQFYCRTPLPSHCSSVPRQACPFQDLLPTSLTDPSLTYHCPCSHTLAFNTRLCNCVLDTQSASSVKSPEHAAPHQVEPTWDWPTVRPLCANQRYQSCKSRHLPELRASGVHSPALSHFQCPQLCDGHDSVSCHLSLHGVVSH